MACSDFFTGTFLDVLSLLMAEERYLPVLVSTLREERSVWYGSAVCGYGYGPFAHGCAVRHTLFYRGSVEFAVEV